MQGTISIVTTAAPPPPATRAEFVPSAASLQIPVPLGATLGKLVIEPAGWLGEIKLSGDIEFIGLDTGRNVVALQALTVAREWKLDYLVTP